MEKIILNVSLRDAKSAANSVRRQGLVPAVVYARDFSNKHLSVDLVAFEKVLKKAGENTVIELLDNEGNTYQVLIQDVQQHYLSLRPTHVDFLKVNMNEVVTSNVPVVFDGVSMAVKSSGGILVKVLDEVTVEALPGNIPHTFSVDLGLLANIDDVIKVSDIKIVEGVKIKNAPSDIIATVKPPRDLEQDLANPVVEDVSKVEVIKKVEKPKEEAAKK